MQARREAMAADLVVVNHHLFFADVMLRDEGMAELLPACNTVIFDEAHQLPEVATLFFGDSLSTAQVLDLARDARAEGLAAARDCLDLQTGSRALEKVAKDLRLAVGLEAGRFSHGQLQERAEFEPGLRALEDALASFAAILETQAQRAEGLEKCWQRALELRQRLALWQNPADPGFVRWAEAFTQSLQLNSTPLDVAEIFRKQIGGHPRAWIFTSATLAVQGQFNHYCSELGLGEPDSNCWDSPFDYGEQAVLYAPLGMPDPNAFHYTEAVVDAAFPVLRAAGGGAFFLCTSLRAMRRTHELLQARLADEGLDMPLLVQGEGSEERTARTLPPPRQRRAGRQPELLGGRGRARRGAVAGRHRQAALRAARRPGARGTHRADEARGAQRFHGIPVAARRHQHQAGRRPADPRRARPRRADDLRSATHSKALRPPRVAKSAADEADARAVRRP